MAAEPAFHLPAATFPIRGSPGEVIPKPVKQDVRWSYAARCTAI